MGVRKRWAVWLAMVIASAGASYSGGVFERAEAARYALIVDTDPARSPLAEVLETSYGFEAVLEPEATGKGIAHSFDWLYERVQPYDQLVVHISLPLDRPLEIGDGGLWYYVPEDGNLEEPWTMVQVNTVVEWLNAMPTGGALLIFPGCGRGVYEGSPLDELTYGSRPGPVEVLQVCDFEALGDLGRDREQSYTWRGDDFAAAVAEILVDAATHDSGTEGEVAVTSYTLAARANERFEDLRAGLYTFPRSEEPVFRFAHVATVDEYRARYEGAKEYFELVAVVQDSIASSDEEAGRVGPIDLLRDIASSANAAAPAVSLEEKEALQLRSYAVDALVRLSSVEARDALREIAVAASDASLIRLIAISALSEDTTPEDVETLRSAVADSDAAVRETAVRALVRARDEGAAAQFASLLPEEMDVRVKISMIQGLSGFRRDEDRELFTSLLADQHWGTRKEAVAALSGLSPDQGTNSKILSILADDDEIASVRETAAYALARTVLEEQRNEIVIGLRKALETAAEKGVASETVRGAAASSLGRIGGREAEGALIATLGNVENSERLRIAAAGGLGRQKSVTAVQVLSQAARPPSPSGLRRAAITALGSIGTSEAGAVLYAALEDEDEYVRREARRWVEELGVKTPTSELDALIAALGAESASEREKAVDILANSTDPNTIDRVIEALEDGDVLLRSGAAELLGRTKLEDIRIIEALGEAARDADASVRVSAVYALGHRGDRATRYVINATNDRFSGVRLAAVSALAEIGDETSREYLERMAKADSSAQVRRAAAQALTPSKFLRSTTKYRSKKGG